MPKFHIKEAIKFGWNAALDHIGFFVMALLGAWVLGLIPQFFSPHNGETSPLGLIMSVLSFLISALVGLGFIRNTLLIAEGKEPALHHFKPDWPEYWQFVGAILLYTLIVGVGFILLVVPGVIFILTYGLFAYFFVDKGVKPMAALRASAAATKGSRSKLFLLVLTEIGIIIAGAIAFGVGLFVAIPTVLVANAFIYRKLSAGGQEVLPGV